MTMASEPLDNCPEKLPRYVDHDGYLVAGGFPVDGFRSALNYESQDNDLFIVTYPKVSVPPSNGITVTAGAHHLKKLSLTPSILTFSAAPHGPNILCI
jgi:hypothetical protein